MSFPVPITQDDAASVNVATVTGYKREEYAWALIRESTVN